VGAEAGKPGDSSPVRSGVTLIEPDGSNHREGSFVMSLRMSLATLLILGLLAPAVSAQPADRIDARQRAQAQRIQAGIERGTITADEARRLAALETRLGNLERRLRASGGRLTAGERLRLHRALTQLSRAIARAARSEP
jgi:hypothetical protein